MKILFVLSFCLLLSATGCTKKETPAVTDAPAVTENAAPTEASPEMENKEEAKTEAPAATPPAGEAATADKGGDTNSTAKE